MNVSEKSQNAHTKYIFSNCWLTKYLSNIVYISVYYIYIYIKVIQCNLLRLVEDRGLGSLVRKSNTDLKRETGRVYSAVFPLNVAIAILTKVIPPFSGLTVLRCSVPQISTDWFVLIIVALDLHVCWSYFVDIFIIFQDSVWWVMTRMLIAFNPTCI